jgi:hypothetical protein
MCWGGLHRANRLLDVPPLYIEFPASPSVDPPKPSKLGSEAKRPIPKVENTLRPQTWKFRFLTSTLRRPTGTATQSKLMCESQSMHPNHHPSLWCSLFVDLMPIVRMLQAESMNIFVDDSPVWVLRFRGLGTRLLPNRILSVLTDSGQVFWTGSSRRRCLTRKRSVLGPWALEGTMACVWPILTPTACLRSLARAGAAIGCLTRSGYRPRIRWNTHMRKWLNSPEFRDSISNPKIASRKLWRTSSATIRSRRIVKTLNRGSHFYRVVFLTSHAVAFS